MVQGGKGIPPWTWHGLASRAGLAGRERGDVSEQPGMAGRGDFDDAGAGALDVGLVVEVAHQDVAGRQLAGRRRNDGDPVGVHVTVGRNRGADLRKAVQLAEERRGCPRGRGRCRG